MTSRNVLREYFAYLYEEGLSQKSRMSYQMDLEQYMTFLETTYSNIEFKDINQEQIRHYLAVLHDDGAKATTISRKISALRRFYKYLFTYKGFKDNPMLKIELPKRQKKLPQFLSEEEIDTLLNTPDMTTLQGIRDKAILEVLYATGMRVSEICDLKVSDIHLDDEMIHIVGKGNKERVVLLGDYAINALMLYYDMVRPKYMSDYLVDEVFLTRRGKAFTRQGIWKLLKELVAKAGITKPISPHVIRHSVATHLLNRGMELPFVQELLGHEHLVTTQIYTQVGKVKIMKDYAMHPHATKEEV